MGRKLQSYVAFLRGVNMGGNNMVSMKKLKADFEKHRFENVVTYINSGNVLFDSARRDVPEMEMEIERILKEDHLAKSKVMIRDAKQMNALVRAMETLEASEDWRHSVIFLSRAADSKKILKELKPVENIEKVVYAKGVLLWSVKTGYHSKSRLGRLSGLALYQEMSARNANTPRKVHALMQQAQKHLDKK